ncbi:hypothetical protein G5B10_08355 [Fluviicola sp. SGL-29]|nr:hypothetical protein [Fluviicola sp. SGL-29]
MMKKKISLLFACTLLVCISCKKDWTCSCTYTLDGTASGSYEINDKSKDDARSMCEATAMSETGDTLVCKIAD